MPKPTSPDDFVQRVFAKYGGREAAIEALERGFAETNARWMQDTDLIGRILRSHLFVEHYLENYIVAQNPNLEALRTARLSFSQKVSLANLDASQLSELRPGIERLNTVRNRLAHKLLAEITSEDVQVFLSAKRFVALRMEGARSRGATPSGEPLALLEDFAMHSGMMLDSAVNNPFAGCFDEE